MALHTEVAEVHGHCDERFGAVAEELRTNLAQRGELGASVCVTVDGETVVDLWGGHADLERSQPWEQDTIAVMMSCTKGATALCAHMLAVAGELDLDAPVSRYWPEFAAAGKSGVLVRHVLSHQAGVPALRAPVEPGAFFDQERMGALLAAEEPWWEPGTAYGYHGLTFGYLVGEIVERVTGSDLGTFFADEVARPLEIDLHIGLPESELARVTRVQPAQPPAPGDPIPPFLLLALTDPTSVQGLMMGNTGGYFLPGAWDAPDALSAVNGSAGGVGNARSLAALYRAIVHDRAIGRVSFDYADVERMSAVQSAVGSDRVLLGPARWSLGFMRGAESPAGVEPPARVIIGADAFGHLGHGGSIGFADPSCGLSFAYVMKQMAPDQGLGPTGPGVL